jgi:hypothetical protein
MISSFTSSSSSSPSLSVTCAPPIFFLCSSLALLLWLPLRELPRDDSLRESEVEEERERSVSLFEFRSEDWRFPSVSEEATEAAVANGWYADRLDWDCWLRICPSRACRELYQESNWVCKVARLFSKICPSDVSQSRQWRRGKSPFGCVRSQV